MKELTSKLGLTLIVGISVLIPSVGETADRTVNCNLGRSIGSVVESLRDGDVLNVVGTCNENVSITELRPNNITLDGGGTATISGPDATSAVIQIAGRRANILNFASITGGRAGIQLLRGASATISGNTIQGVGRQGIIVLQTSFATIVNNTIQNNVDSGGISVSESSSARIGFITAQDTVASPNTIIGNGTSSGSSGIGVDGNSFAQIVGNIINGNGLGGGTPSGNGIIVTQASSAEISSNSINNNAQDGIAVGRNSFVQLGSDTGSGIFDAPNSGSGNGRNGVRCFINSSADGRIGTLTGNAGALDFSVGGCISSLILPPP